MENKRINEPSNEVIIIVINKCQIKINKEKLVNSCLLFKKTLELIKEEYSFVIDKIKDKYIKLFFELITEFDESKINIVNFTSLYFLSEYFQADTIKNYILDFVSEFYTDRNTDHMLDPIPESYKFPRYNKILNELSWEHQSRELVNFYSKVLLV